MERKQLSNWKILTIRCFSKYITKNFNRLILKNCKTERMPFHRQRSLSVLAGTRRRSLSLYTGWITRTVGLSNTTRAKASHTGNAALNFQWREYFCSLYTRFHDSQFFSLRILRVQTNFTEYVVKKERLVPQDQLHRIMYSGNVDNGVLELLPEHLFPNGHQTRNQSSEHRPHGLQKEVARNEHELSCDTSHSRYFDSVNKNEKIRY